MAREEDTKRRLKTQTVIVPVGLPFFAGTGFFMKRERESFFLMPAVEQPTPTHSSMRMGVKKRRVSPMSRPLATAPVGLAVARAIEETREKKMIICARMAKLLSSSKALRVEHGV